MNFFKDFHKKQKEVDDIDYNIFFILFFACKTTPFALENILKTCKRRDLKSLQILKME